MINLELTPEQKTELAALECIATSAKRRLASRSWRAKRMRLTELIDKRSRNWADVTSEEMAELDSLQTDFLEQNELLNAPSMHCFDIRLGRVKEWLMRRGLM